MQLLKHFHELSLHLANARELKSLILQLAVQGKLTAEWRKENPDIESAILLLEQVKKEKIHLAKEGKVRKGKPLPPITENEIPYGLPESWGWCRLGEYIHNFGQKKPDIQFTYIDVGSIDNDSGYVKHTVTNLLPQDAPTRARKILQKGCIIYSTVRPYLLNIALIDQDYNYEPIASTAFAVLNPLAGCSPKYLFHFLRSNIFTSYVESQMIGVAYPAINDVKLMRGLIPIPPLEEQKAIVVVVEQLFKEVEQLEQLTEKRIQLKEQFATSALHDLTTNNTVKEWEVLQPHFHTFFNEAPNIKKLREAILQLAVQGKLTAHWRGQNSPYEGGTGDIKDHDAALLLEKIKAEKTQLIKEGKIKKEKPLPTIANDEIPCVLPEGWGYEYMRNISSVVTCGIASTPQYTDSGRIFLSAKNVKPFTFKPEEHKFVSQELYEKITRNAKPEKKDILLTRVGAGIGEACVIDQNIDFAFYVSLTLVKPLHKFIDSYYVLYWLSSKDGIGKVLDNIYGKGVSQGNLNVNQVRQFVLPIPPLNEQNAIVETVNRLMALCDALEQQVTFSKEQSEKWMKGVLREVITE